MGNRGYSLHRSCPSEKSVYEECENLYWQQIKQGINISNPCRDQWEDYKACVIKDWEKKLTHFKEKQGQQQSAANSQQ